MSTYFLPLKAFQMNSFIHSIHFASANLRKTLSTNGDKELKKEKGRSPRRKPAETLAKAGVNLRSKFVSKANCERPK